MCLFFFNDTATTEIYTLSLHDALPIFLRRERRIAARGQLACGDGVRVGLKCLLLRLLSRLTLWVRFEVRRIRPDRKSTRLNSSHANISYAVFCLKKKKIYIHTLLSFHT